MKLKWLIFGGNGQLGRCLRAEFERHGEDFQHFSHDEIDITNEISVSKALHEHAPDVVINAAAWTNVDGAELEKEAANNVNAFGPKIIAQECARNRSKFVHFSTDYVFSGKSSQPWKENESTCPSSSYGLSKAEGEKLVLREYLDGTYVVRTAWLYSNWGTNFAKTMARLAIKDSELVRVVSNQIGQPTSATHLAKQVRQMVKAGIAPGIYHGTNSGEASWFQFAEEIFRLMGADVSRVIPDNSASFRRLATRPLYSVLGHQQWLDAGFLPMCDWRKALYEALPSILSSINLEE
jgi:dTDP-4-dehydrorhamnose reductase